MQYMTRATIRCILALGLLAVLPGLAEQEPPKELLQYIRDARKAGLKDDQIQQNARQAGWSTSAVAEAIRSMSGTAQATPPSSEVAHDRSTAPSPPVAAPAGAKPAETPAVANPDG